MMPMSNVSMELFTDASSKDALGSLQGKMTNLQPLIGLQHKLKRILPGRSSMPLPLLLTHGNHRKIRIHCDNQTVVKVWEKGTCKSPLLYVYYTFVLLTVTLMFVSSIFLVSRLILQILLHYHFRIIASNTTYSLMSSLLGFNKSSLLPPNPVDECHVS